jgi:HlyD family secretion protein
VSIAAGAPAEILRWGGDAPLRAAVRLVEPSAFTKVSALGVDEQRVNVILDLLDPPEARPRLGDGYRVEVSITVYQASDVTIVPAGALFRRADRWAAFVVVDGRARLREVQPGPRGDLDVEVLSGLSPGDTVIIYPGDRVAEGVRVASP